MNLSSFGTRLMSIQATALLFGLVCFSLALGGAVSDDEHQHPWQQVYKELKYPKGNRIGQKHYKPKVETVQLAPWGGVEAHMAMAAAVPDTPQTTDYGLKPHTIVSLNVNGEMGEGAVPLTQAKQAGYFEFDVLYKNEIPIAKASRSLVTFGGKTLFVRDRNLPEGQLTPDATKPIVPFEKARENALKDAVDLFRKMYGDANPLLVVSNQTGDIPELQLVPDLERSTAKLAWRFSITSTKPATPFLRKYWVSALEGNIIDFEDRIYYAAPPQCDHATTSKRTTATFSFLRPVIEREPVANSRPLTSPQGGTSGVVTGRKWKESPYHGGLESAPLPGVDILIKQGNTVFSARTNLDGIYSLPQVTGQVQVTATLAGPYCKVANQAGENISITKVGAGNINLEFATQGDPEGVIAQVSAFHGINTAFNFVRPYLPNTPSLLLNMPTNVNINQTCNAFYSPGAHTINFFRSAPGGCANSAYADVVCHEYGHAVDDQLGGILDGGYSEGFGDTLTLLITRQSIVGRDFRGPPTPTQSKHLRDALQAPKWPDVEDAEAHDQGWAYSGFSWRLISNLRTMYNDDEQAFSVAKRLLLAVGVQNPRSIPEAVRFAFFQDAQQFPGPANQKSKHFQQIKEAADFQKIPYPPTNPEDLLSSGGP